MPDTPQDADLAALTDLRARPHVRGTLMNLPGTVDRAAKTFEAAGVADRIEVAGQSFSDPLPAGADLYLLKKAPIASPSAAAHPA